MIPISLKKLLKKETAALVRDIVTALDAKIGIQDEKGVLLLGAEHKDFSTPKYLVELEGEPLGWVVGAERADVVAALLAHLAKREGEYMRLRQEAVARAKEMHLRKTLAVRLASCFDVPAVARVTIEEARNLIAATSASVMLLNPQTRVFEIIAAAGTLASSTLVLVPGHGVAGNVLLTGKGVVINDVQAAPEFIKGPTKISSLICVPLKVAAKMIGVLNISSEEPQHYTLADLRLATALADQAAVAIKYARLQAERLAQERLTQELDIARKLQQSLLPNLPPLAAGMEVAAWSLPAAEVGGDFYDFIPLPDAKLGFVIADVSGKGMPAARSMAIARALMRANALQTPHIARAVAQTNRLLPEFAASGLFVTLFYAVVDTHARGLHYVSAGHHPPLLYQSRTGAAQWLEADGLALGVMDDIELEEKEVALAAGDVIVFYTDGVTKTLNRQNEEFGAERLSQVISTHPELAAGELSAKIRTAVLAFAGDAPQVDDLTVMVVKVTQTDSE